MPRQAFLALYDKLYNQGPLVGLVINKWGPITAALAFHLTRLFLLLKQGESGF